MWFTRNLPPVCYGNSLSGLKWVGHRTCLGASCSPITSSKENTPTRNTGQMRHVKEDPPETGRWHAMGPLVPQDSHVSGRIKNERTVCKDSELIHPKDMRMDPFVFIWNFSGT